MAQAAQALPRKSVFVHIPSTHYIAMAKAMKAMKVMKKKAALKAAMKVTKQKAAMKAMKVTKKKADMKAANKAMKVRKKKDMPPEKRRQELADKARASMNKGYKYARLRREALKALKAMKVAKKSANIALEKVMKKKATMKAMKKKATMKGMKAMKMKATMKATKVVKKKAGMNFKAMKVMKKKAMKVGKKKNTVMKAMKVMKKQAAVKATKAMKKKAATEPMKVIKKKVAMKAMKKFTHKKMASMELLSVMSKKDKFWKLANKLLDKLCDAEDGIDQLVNLGRDCQSTWATIQNCPQEVTASVKRMVTYVPNQMAELMRDMEARLNQLTWTALPEE